MWKQKCACVVGLALLHFHYCHENMTRVAYSSMKDERSAEQTWRFRARLRAKPQMTGRCTRKNKWLLLSHWVLGWFVMQNYCDSSWPAQCGGSESLAKTKSCGRKGEKEKVGISKIQENEGSWAGLWAEVCMWVDPYNRCNFWGPFLFNYPSLLVKFDLHTRSCMVGIENKVWAGTCGGGQTPTQGLCPGIPGSDYSEVAMTHSQDANSWGELAIARKNFLEEI